MHSLDELNTASPDAFITALAGVFEHGKWVAEAALPQRPFATVAALHEAMLQAVRAAPTAAAEQFLRGHPALSSKALADPAITAESRSEQGGLGMARLGSELERFERGQAEYERRFGFPFIICVRRQTPPFVLRALEQRLGNTPEQEIAAALHEVGHITRLRLADRVEGPGMPQMTGHLSAHVLDTVRGKAAEGIRIDVLREGVRIAQAVTNADGRTDAPLLSQEPLRIGRYELVFHVADYLAGCSDQPDPPWYDVIPIRFAIAEPEGRYHVPLLLGAWSYTTYRGT